MSKMLKGSKPEVQKLIEKVESITVKERPDWLETYRNDDEGESPVAYTDKDNNLGKSILDRLTNEIRERVENEPGITLDEIQEQMNNEINNN
jgi:predicted GTPase